MHCLYGGRWTLLTVGHLDLAPFAEAERLVVVRSHRERMLGAGVDGVPRARDGARCRPRSHDGHRREDVELKDSENDQQDS